MQKRPAPGQQFALPAAARVSARRCRPIAYLWPGRRSGRTLLPLACAPHPPERAARDRPIAARRLLGRPQVPYKRPARIGRHRCARRSTRRREPPVGGEQSGLQQRRQVGHSAIGGGNASMRARDRAAFPRTSATDRRCCAGAPTLCLAVRAGLCVCNLLTSLLF